jgi:C4-dicarboxylate-specific signal transduction histidine kinase
VTLNGSVAPGLICALPRGRIHQVLMNLVWNSVEALGPRPGTVGVTGQTEGDGVALEVWDDGPGFPAELLGRRVQAFRTRRAGGTGLGLMDHVEAGGR